MVHHISDSVGKLSNNVTAKVGPSEQVDPSKVELSIEAEQRLPAEKTKKMADSMNKFLETTSTEIRFKYHEELETYYVTLINAKTEEVIREIPSKKIMDMYASMRDLVGFIVDKKI
ncbi:flagellar protein FlaG [uncultured Psychrobacillus sp.]|uniref:flagellar protein FlaG n=1 Tax=uncultured Psychrobacillus sp. TaxID=1551585 RepID=UPI0026223B74|nr:flagellar protein FlaG [uncultured Psychrobacillus sp.]